MKYKAGREYGPLSIGAIITRWIDCASSKSLYTTDWPSDFWLLNSSRQKVWTCLGKVFQVKQAFLVYLDAYVLKQILVSWDPNVGKKSNKM